VLAPARSEDCASGRGGGADLQRQGVNAAHKAGTQRAVHRPVPVDPAHGPEGWRDNDHTEMAFAFFAPATMTPVLVAFIDNLKDGRHEGRSQTRMNFIRYPHFRLFPPSIPRQNP